MLEDGHRGGRERGIHRVYPISYIILIFVSRIVDQRLSYALPLQSIIDFPDIHPFLWLLSLWWSLSRFSRGWSGALAMI